MPRTTKFQLIKTQPEVSLKELCFCLVILCLASYILAPRFWEPGAESFKNWASAQVFRQTWGFPVLHHGPLYNIYLQFFLFFDYPLSIQLEHFVTHLFAYISIYLLIRRFLPGTPALLLICAWIPLLWTIQGGARVAGIGFLALYFLADRQSALNKGYFPASLGAAAFFDSAYIPFLLGHIIGTVLERRSKREPIASLSCFWRQGRITPIIVKAVIILIVILTMFFQSKRSDHNPLLIDYPWAPFPQDGAITISCLQFGNWNYVTRNVPESEWIYKDWYFTHEDAFGGASSIPEAIFNNPKVFFSHILDNVTGIIKIPLDYISGFYFRFCFGGVGLSGVFLSWLLLPIGFYGIYKYFKVRNLLAHLYSIGFGTGAIVGVLLLTNPSERYVMVLFPVGFLMTIQIATNFPSLIRHIYNWILSRSNNKSVIDVSSRGHNIIYFIGVLMVLSGFLVNRWSVGVLAPHIMLKTSSQLMIWIIDIILIGGGTFMVIKRDFVLSIIKYRNDSSCTTTQSWMTTIIVLVMAGCIFFSLHNRYGKDAGVRNLSVNPFSLSGKMSNVRHELLSSVDKTTRVLANEEPWIKSFTDVDLDNVFHPLYLPPFKDASGDTERFLKSLDVIWVSNGFAAKRPHVATQIYLRYLLHVEPFLKKALKNGWTVQDVEGFGKIYKRSTSD